MRQKKRELHELPYTELVKSGTIRLGHSFTHIHITQSYTHTHKLHKLFLPPLYTASENHAASSSCGDSSRDGFSSIESKVAGQRERERAGG